MYDCIYSFFKKLFSERKPCMKNIIWKCCKRKIVIKTWCQNLYQAPNSCQFPTINYHNYPDFIKDCKENLPPPWTHGIGTAKESPIRQIVKTKRILKLIFGGDCCHVWNQNWTGDKPKNSLWFKVSPSNIIRC